MTSADEPATAIGNKESVMKTAIPRMDLRRHRAQSLTAQFLHLVDPYLADDARRDRLADALQKLFWEEGVEVITDHDRALMGLPPRGPDGWTAEELWAMEKRRLDLMSQPLVFTMPRTDDIA